MKTAIKTKNGISTWGKYTYRGKAKNLQKRQTNFIHAITIQQRINKLLMKFIFTPCGYLQIDRKRLHLMNFDIWIIKTYSSFTKYDKVKLVTLVEGDPKAPFSIATTLRCRGGRYSIPKSVSLYPYLIVLSVKQGGIKYHFWVIGITRPEIELRSLGPLANTLLISEHSTALNIFLWYLTYLSWIYKLWEIFGRK